MATPLSALDTPCLLLDEARLRANISHLVARLDHLGVAFRPHLKTAKSLDIARLAMTTATGPAMVSTLREAEYFAAGGVRDMIYGVGIAPSKLERVHRLRLGGAQLMVILDSLAQAEAIVAHVARTGDRQPVLIEVDPDGHRSGVRPDDAATLIAIGRTLVEGGATLAGVLLHAGESYALSEKAALAAAAEAERLAAVTAAHTLRSAGLPCPIVSVGSTPTATHAQDLTGVTEVRAGVFMFGDLVQVGIGAQRLEDIAISVLTTVIGHRADKGWIITDGGWMALSRDRGTQGQAIDQGYGLVCDAAGAPYPDLIVVDTNQEHGVIARRPGATAALPDLKLGTLLRILPNHACATAAQYDRYQILDPEGGVATEWPRINGW